MRHLETIRRGTVSPSGGLGSRNFLRSRFCVDTVGVVSGSVVKHAMRHALRATAADLEPTPMTLGLRSTDALQLAAALVAAGDRPAGHEFVCLDARLATAATREGYRLPQP